MKIITQLPQQAHFLLIPLSFFLITACPDPPPVELPRDTTIKLEVLSTLATLARLRISVEDTSAEWTFGLRRNERIFLITTVYSNDTTFVDNGLIPNTENTYQAFWMENGEKIDSSLIVTTHTMDTTNHNFTWEVVALHTPSLGQSNEWYDVQIIDENNIWVVGSVKTDTANYNAAHWDGSEWELLKIVNGSIPLYSIEYFSADDIWLTTFGLPIHWDGQEWTLYHIQQMGLDVSAGFDSWGTSSSNMYFVGYEGGIVHYDGSTFTKIESGTDVNLNSICSTGPNTLFISGFRATFEGRSVLIKIENGIVEKLLDYEITSPYLADPDSISGFIQVIHSFGNDDIIVYTNWGAYHCFSNTQGEGDWQTWTSDPQSHPTSITGTGMNDYFTTCQLTESIHFNGLKHRKFSIPGSRWATASDMKDDLLVIVTGAGKIIKGYRQ